MVTASMVMRWFPAWTTSDAGVPLNTADVLPDGSKVDGVATLRQALVKRPDLFVQTVVEKLLVYALGRGLTFEDMPAVRAVVRESRNHDYRFQSLVTAIVGSVPFQMRTASGSGLRASRTAASSELQASSSGLRASR